MTIDETEKLDAMIAVLQAAKAGKQIQWRYKNHSGLREVLPSL